jgi:hypothetical protein
MKKTNRKNKINQMVNWPKNIFTIEELHALNDSFIEITLRDHIKKAKADGKIVEVGQLHNGKGRPRLVLAYAPITQDHIAEAKSKGIILKDGLSINVMNIQPVEEKVTTIEISNITKKDAAKVETVI